MILIILIALGTSFFLTISYSIVESACVHSSHRMPYQRDVWGGECREEIGLFWSVFYLEPLTSIDDPAPSYGPEISFRLKPFLLINLCATFALWIILSLINRYFKPVIIVVGSLATGFVLIYGGKKLKKSWDDSAVELTNITIITSDIHPGVYNSMFYPHEACYLIPPSDRVKYGYAEYEHMDNNDIVQPGSIKGKELRRIINATKDIKEKTDTDWKKEFVYKIVVVYKTRDGYDSIRVNGYGDFPEGWSGYIRLINETCGINYLREDPEAVSFTPEWFSETYGIYDDDIAGDITVKEYLESQRITLQNASCMNDSGNLFRFDPGLGVEMFNMNYN